MTLDETETAHTLHQSLDPFPLMYFSAACFMICDFFACLFSCSLSSVRIYTPYGQRPCEVHSKTGTWHMKGTQWTDLGNLCV